MSSHNRWMLAALLCAGMMGTGALGKTKLVQSWADPSAPKYRFSKVLAVAVIEHPDIRRMAEAAIVRNVKKARAVSSCTVLQPGEERDVEKAKQRLREGGFDGAVVIRLFDVNHTVQHVAPNFPNTYNSYWSYNTTAWPITATPGYIKYEQIVQIETLFYSLKDDKLLWAGVSETSNPQGASALVDDIAKVVVKELKKKGIVK